MLSVACSIFGANESFRCPFLDQVLNFIRTTDPIGLDNFFRRGTSRVTALFRNPIKYREVIEQSSACASTRCWQRGFIANDGNVVLHTLRRLLEQELACCKRRIRIDARDAVVAQVVD